MRVGIRVAFVVMALVMTEACAPAAAPAPTTPPAASTAPTAAPQKPAAASSPSAAASPAPSAAASPAVAASPAASPAAAPSPVAAATKPVAAPSGPVENVKMGYSNISGDDLAAYYAVETGLFPSHNLNVDAQLIAGGANTTAALLSGQIQIAQAGGSESLSAVANGADLVIVATLAGVYPYYFEVIPDVKTFQDLVGKKIGVSNVGGSADIATRVVLRQHGLDPDKDVTIVPTGSAQNRASALASGAIQGGMAGPPDSLSVEAIGLYPLLDLASQHLPSANTVVVVQRSFAEVNHAVVQHYVDAMIDANVRLKADKPKGVDVLKKYFQSQDDHAMDVAYDFYANEVLQALPFSKPEQFKDAIDALSASNPKIKDVDLNKLLDTSFVQDAQNRGLGR